MKKFALLILTLIVFTSCINTEYKHTKERDFTIIEYVFKDSLGNEHRHEMIENRVGLCHSPECKYCLNIFD